MATLTIQVEDNSVMAGLKKVLEAMKGVVIVPNHQKSMSGIEEAMDDIRHGRVTEYESADDMFEKLGIWNSKPPIQRKVGWMKNIIFAAVLKFI